MQRQRDKLIIVGAGGFGREVYQWAKELPCFEIKGFVDEENAFPRQLPLSILGNDDWAISQAEETFGKKVCYALALGSSVLRARLDQKYSTSSLTPVQLIHESVMWGSQMEMGKGCIICAASILTTDIRIGNFVVINLQCTVGHDCVIGDYVTLHPGVRLSGHVTVGKGAEIGTGAIVLPGVAIGQNCTIGAGAVVTKDCEGGKTYVGVPARELRK